MSVENSSKILNVGFKSAIAPVIGPKIYTDLLKQYETTGAVPRRLEITGMVVDASENANHWRIPETEFKALAEQMPGQQVRKDHADSVDAIIGKINEAWVEDGRIWAKAEIADEDIIKKILLGYLRFSSIQVMSDDVYCANCLENKKGEATAKLEDINAPCPVCGQLKLEVRKPQFIEWSTVALPAYSNAVYEAIGFKAALDAKLAKRFAAEEKKVETGTPLMAGPELTEEQKVVPLILGASTLLMAIEKAKEEGILPE